MKTELTKIWRSAIPFLQKCRPGDLLHTAVAMLHLAEIMGGEGIDDDTLMEYDSIEGIYPAKMDWVYERKKVKVTYDDGSEDKVWIYVRKGFEGGELIENGQFDNWRDDGICPIPEDKLVK